MRFEDYSFGSVTIDGRTYEHDVVVDGGAIRKRKKGPSKALGISGHTPLSVKEEIPWDAGRLVIGTGDSGSLPVMDEVEREAARRDVDLVMLPTAEAIEVLNKGANDTNAILHVTC